MDRMTVENMGTRTSSVEEYVREIMGLKEAAVIGKRRFHGQDTEIYWIREKTTGSGRVFVVKLSSRCREEEARILSEMEDISDFFPALYHVGEYGGKTILIMEACVTVKDAFQMIRPEEKGQYVQKLTCEVLYGLMDLERAGWIHSDIKPDNLVFISRHGLENSLNQGHFGLIDTGSAVRMGEPLDSFTEAYAPDMDKYGWKACHVLDTYGLGVTAYELLTEKTFHKHMESAEMRRDLEEALCGQAGRYRHLVNTILRALNEEYQDLTAMMTDLRGKTVRRNTSQTVRTERERTESTLVTEMMKKGETKKEKKRASRLLPILCAAIILLVGSRFLEEYRPAERRISGSTEVVEEIGKTPDGGNVGIESTEGGEAGDKGLPTESTEDSEIGDQGLTAEGKEGSEDSDNGTVKENSGGSEVGEKGTTAEGTEGSEAGDREIKTDNKKSRESKDTGKTEPEAETGTSQESKDTGDKEVKADSRTSQESQESQDTGKTEVKAENKTNQESQDSGSKEVKADNKTSQENRNTGKTDSGVVKVSTSAAADKDSSDKDGSGKNSSVKQDTGKDTGTIKNAIPKISIPKTDTKNETQKTTQNMDTLESMDPIIAMYPEIMDMGGNISNGQVTTVVDRSVSYESTSYHYEEHIRTEYRAE